MSTEPAKLLEEALNLPANVRAALAGSLMDSLDESVDEDAEDAWALELAKRLRELAEGRVACVPWSEARRRIAGEE